MNFYKLGSFYDKLRVIRNLQDWADLDLADSVFLERRVRLYCHNLISDGILNFDVDAQDIYIFFSYMNEKIAQIIAHNFVELNFFKVGSDLLDTFEKSGETRSETKYNPIDNDNDEANLTISADIKHNSLEQLATAIEGARELSKLLADIYSELQLLTLRSVNSSIIKQVVRYDITDLITVVNLTVADASPATIINEFDKANNLSTFNAEIVQFLRYRPLEGTINGVITLYFNKYWSMDPIEVEVTINE